MSAARRGWCSFAGQAGAPQANIYFRFVYRSPDGLPRAGNMTTQFDANMVPEVATYRLVEVRHSSLRRTFQTIIFLLLPPYERSRLLYDCV